MALFVERWAVLCSCSYSLCAQSHTAVTLTVRPIILCILHPQMGAESQHRVDEWDERQFTAARRLQSLKTIKFPLELQAPHIVTHAHVRDLLLGQRRRLFSGRGGGRGRGTKGAILYIWKDNESSDKLRPMRWNCKQAPRSFSFAVNNYSESEATDWETAPCEPPLLGQSTFCWIILDFLCAPANCAALSRGV